MSDVRLIAYAPDGIQRFPVDGDDLVIGSARDCDIRLRPHHVAPRHARLRRRKNGIEIESLNDSAEVEVNGRPVRKSKVKSLDQIRLGDVTLVLDDVDWEERDKGSAAGTSEPESSDRATLSRPAMLGMVAEVSDWVVGDYSSNRSLESILISLLRKLGGGVIFLFVAAGEKQDFAVKFVVSTEAEWIGNGEELLGAIRAEESRTDASEPSTGVDIERGLSGNPTSIYSTQIHALDRDYRILGAFPELTRERRRHELPGLVHTLGNLIILGLVHHVGHFEPILPGKQPEAALTLAPGLVLGESEASLRLVDRLRALMGNPGPILMIGEAGCEFGLLARSLHLSGDRSEAPFVSTGCSGADIQQLDVELFGAEVPGKKDPLRRRGKLQEADGGTLLIEDIDRMPMVLQDKLARFLRFGQVGMRGSKRLSGADVRLMTTSTVPLTSLIDQGTLRVDLAFLLDRARLEVPPLRARREDLPLLIQWLTNRFCHNAGKRIQGITLKAMGALTQYDYPGNLVELENTVRELVFACPSGEPVHMQDLPPQVRNSRDRPLGMRITAASDLRLDDLLAREEEAAIREALRRTDGNKSQAARLLGISRNGLAMKMQRHGIDS